jgi:hypothetical protein
MTHFTIYTPQTSSKTVNYKVVFYITLTSEYSDYGYWPHFHVSMTLMTASSQGETRLLQLRITCSKGHRRLMHSCVACSCFDYPIRQRIKRFRRPSNALVATSKYVQYHQKKLQAWTPKWADASPTSEVRNIKYRYCRLGALKKDTLRKRAAISRYVVHRLPC